MRQYPYLLMTLILGAILIPPFLLKMLSSSLEPYPAIILPAGAHQVELGDNQVNFTRLSLWGKKTKTDSWQRIDSEKFLEPIPHEYLGHITHNSFGLEISERGLESSLKQKFVAILRNKITEDEMEETKTWLSNKLLEQNLNASQLRITNEEVVFDINTGKIVFNEITNEKIFKLD